VFISWAEERGKAVALALHAWIPMVLHNAKPWVSAVDIGSGERWSPAIAKELSVSRFGIICLTPESANRPWVLFEAGAIAKSIEVDARVCPYLFGFDKPTDLPAGPLSQFQARNATEDETRELMRDLNKALGTAGVERDRFERLYTRLWPDLKTDLAKIPTSLPSTPKKRAIEELVPEILETVRTIERRLPGLVAPPPNPLNRLWPRYKYLVAGAVTEENASQIVRRLAALGDIEWTEKLHTGRVLDGVQFTVRHPGISMDRARSLLNAFEIPDLVLLDEDGVILAKTQNSSDAPPST
jgi:hypothetical protein